MYHVYCCICIVYEYEEKREEDYEEECGWKDKYYSTVMQCIFCSMQDTTPSLFNIY